MTKKIPLTFSSQSPAPQAPHISEIDMAELATKKDLVHLIDVREDDEYVGELGHVDGARLINLSNVPDQLDQLPKDEPIVFICKSGGRSLQAAAFASQQGYKYVYNAKGGMMQWNRLGLPILK